MSTGLSQYIGIPLLSLFASLERWREEQGISKMTLLGPFLSQAHLSALKAIHWAAT